MAVKTKELLLASKHLNEIIPTSWELVELGDVCSVLTGFPFESKFFNDEKGIPIIRIRDIKKTTTAKKYDGKFDKKFLVSKNDFLIGMDGDFNCSKWKGEQGLLNQRVCKIEVNSKFLNPNLFFYGINRHLQAIHAGTSSQTVTHLSHLTINAIEFPLPSLNEQKRIVSKIEELFSKIDSTKKSLEHTKLQLVQYRQSLLKYAFDGKLTEKWREVNNDRIEPVAKLLTKILNEQNSGSEENLNIEQELPNLPESWIWSSIKTICKNHDHQRIPISAKKRKQIQGKIPYYGASGIIDYVEKPIFSGKYFLIAEDGANLISRSTPVGFIAEGDFWVNNHAHILSTYGNIPLEFLSYYIASVSLRPWISGTAQPKLNQENLKKIPVPLPPLEEQEQIVSQIEQGFSLIQNSQRIVNSTLQTLETMRMSVLKQAFEGKIVPQDPNDEPASVLLEKIKNAQVAQKPKQGRAKNVK